ncbi:non-ribosomal peptide synthetase [Peribacillus simplex]|uniref:non-ribosomal peptide synthetase n=1 Tax=Peribacillus simplex TaxID=1478 RepID=UPI003D26F74D
MFVLTEEMVKKREFWMQQLSGDLPLSALVPDAISFSNQGPQAVGIVEATMEQNLFNRLEHYCKESDFLWYCFLFAGLNVCLYKYSGQQDQLLGSPQQGDISKTGNMLPIRSKIDPELSFKEWVLQIRTGIAAAYANQQIPLDSLIGELGLSGNERPDSLFGFVALMEGMHTTLPFNADQKYIQLTFSRRAGRLDMKLQYPTGRYRDDTMQRFVVHLNHVLQSAVLHIDKAIKEISICSLDEESQILNKFNRSVPTLEKKITIADQFELQVSTQPDKNALIHGGKRMTYRELDIQSNQIASILRKQWNIQPGEFVAVCMNRGVEYIISVLAVLKAGGAYVPLDVDYPDERIHFILEDSGAKLMLTDKETEKTEFSIPILQVSEQLQSSEQSIGIRSTAKSEDLAYLLYTSGTTGKPKGTLIEHRNVINLVMETDYLTFDSQTSVMQVSSIVFDLSTLEIWGTLLNGGTLVIVDKQTLLAPTELQNTIQKYKINSAILTTALFHHLASHHTAVFTGIEQLLTGGETLSAVLAKKTLQIHPKLRLVNAYGPTECTVLTTAHDIKHEEKGTIPIGKPIPRTKVIITGADGQIQPIGVPGELYIGGNAVGRGYLNRQKLTMERYVADPYEPSRNMYKTGDLARWRDDGNIEFLGRKDRQVKLRGYRIELGEIENTLLKHRDIREAVVLPIQNSGELLLCAYYIHAVKEEVHVNDLPVYLKRHLPEYMVPAAFVPVTRLPLTVSGKLDATKLPFPNKLHFGFQQQEPQVLPRNDEEKKISTIWTDILGIQQIGIYQNFFELGGHSLKLIMLAEELQQAGYHVNTMDLYKYPTISSFLEYQRSQ